MDTQKPYSLKYVLFSIENEKQLDFAYRDHKHRMSVSLRNLTPKSFELKDSAGPPTIRIAFQDPANVSFDVNLVECRGFKVASYEQGVLDLVLSYPSLWWHPNDILRVMMPEFSVTGESSFEQVDISIQNFDSSIDQVQQRTLVKLRQKKPLQNDDALVGFHETNTVIVSPSTIDMVENSLLMKVTPPEGQTLDVTGIQFFVSPCSGNGGNFKLLTSPFRAEHIELRPTPGWSNERINDSGLPVWRVQPDGPSPRLGSSELPSLDIDMNSIVSDQPPGYANVAVYQIGGPTEGDTYSILNVNASAGSVDITDLKVSPEALNNINKPTAVQLSWRVDNASVVTLSGVGVVGAIGDLYEVIIEETTTFVLTAFDSSLSQIASKTITVPVNPSLVTRLVPDRMIMLWSGSVAEIGSLGNWVLCDGANGTPDLRDRFVMGAGSNPNTFGPADTHTHPVPQMNGTFATSSDGLHNHGMPSTWYTRYLSCGVWSGIDVRGEDVTKSRTSTDGLHYHSVEIKIPTFESGINNGGVRPPWYALCYIMKVKA